MISCISRRRCRPPDFVREAGLGWTEGKLAADAWVMVDKETLVHKTYPNIVSLGDVAGIPTSKTSAAIRKQGADRSQEPDLADGRQRTGREIRRICRLPDRDGLRTCSLV